MARVEQNGYINALFVDSLYSRVPSRREAPTALQTYLLNWTKKVWGIGSSIIKLDAMASHLCKQSEAILPLVGHENAP